MQLFMIESLRRGILAVDGAADNIEEELLNDEKPENEVNIFSLSKTYNAVMQTDKKFSIGMCNVSSQRKSIILYIYFDAFIKIICQQTILNI